MAGIGWGAAGAAATACASPPGSACPAPARAPPPPHTAHRTTAAVHQKGLAFAGHHPLASFVFLRRTQCCVAVLALSYNAAGP